MMTKDKSTTTDVVAAIANKIVEVRRALDAFNYKRKQHLSRTVETTLQEIEQAFGNKSYTEAEHLIEVIHILIAREARRSGIGTKLLDAITQDLGELGVFVSPTNVVGQAFFRHLNFKPVINEGEYQGHGEHWNLSPTTA